MESIDKFQFVYIIFLIHGIGTILPWNMIINANDYFVNYKLNVNDNSTEELKSYRRNFLSYLGIASKTPNLMFQISNLFVTEKIGGTLSTRIMVTIIVQIIYSLFTIILAVMDTQSTPKLFFWLTIASAVVVNMANGVYQSCVYGSAAVLPMRYINAISCGMNFCGIVIAVWNILSVSIAPTAQSMAIIYFSSAVLIFILCFICEISLKYINFYAYYKELEKNNEMKELNVNSKEDKQLNESNKYLYVLQKIYIQLLNIFLLYFVTFSLFPSVQANIDSSNHLIGEKYFLPVFCFLVYNLMGFAGNVSAEYIQQPSPDLMIVFTLCRFLFIPFYLFCNYRPKNINRSLRVLFDNDFIYLLANILLALTNSHLASLSLMYCPLSVPIKYKTIAGMMSSFTVLIGILIGIYFSLVFPLIV